MPSPDGRDTIPAMRTWAQWLLLSIILITALALRWTGLDWDDYNHYHPDERYITWVATSIEWPVELAHAFNPQLSSFNPFYWPENAESEGIVVLQGEPRDFAYGHVPLYLGVITTRLVEKVSPPLISILPDGWLVTQDVLNAHDAIEFRHLTAVARALTGFVDVLVILVIFLIGRRLYGPEVALLASAFLAFNVMHIQIAHFFTSDPYQALFATLALYFMIRSIIDEKVLSNKAWLLRPGVYNLILGAVFIGLAVGSKFSAVLLFLPLLITLLLSRTPHRWWRLAIAALTVGITFFMTNPFAVLDLGCQVLTPQMSLGPFAIPALDWRSCFLQNVITQGAMVRGGVELGFTRQYIATLPFIYPIEMQLRWGMGWLLGILAFAGFGWAIWQGGRYAWRWIQYHNDAVSPALSAEQSGSLILLAWTLPFFITTASFQVKFMRYLLPLTPFLMLYGAALLWQWPNRLGRSLTAGVIVIVTALYAFSFANIYSEDHPWNVASRWVYDHIPQDALIAGEQWDDSLPTSIRIDGKQRLRNEYQHDQLTWLTGPDDLDDEQKLTRNLQILQRADYVTILSNRIYGVVPRLDDRFPLSSPAAQLLFDGSLGYEPVFVNTRTPNLFGLHIKPDTFGWPDLQPPPFVAQYLDSKAGISGGRFDESFTVYDQPLVIIFENVEGKTVEEMRQLFSD